MTNENNDESPLHEAAKNGDFAEGKRLIKGGADVNAEDEHGWMPLHWAAEAGHLEIVHLLVKAKASINAKIGGDGETPLYKAALHCHTETVRFLIREGANVNAKSRGYVPLHAAAEEGDISVAEVLINARADLHICDKDGKTPLQIAISRYGMDSHIARVFHRAMGLE